MRKGKVNHVGILFMNALGSPKGILHIGFEVLRGDRMDSPSYSLREVNCVLRLGAVRGEPQKVLGPKSVPMEHKAMRTSPPKSP